MRDTPPIALRKIVAALDEEERGVLRSLIGIDVDTWRIDPVVFAEHKKRLTNFRDFSKSLQDHDSNTTPFDERKCVGCGKQGAEVYFFVTFVHGTNVCGACLDLLGRYAGDGQ